LDKKTLLIMGKRVTRARLGSVASAAAKAQFSTTMDTLSLQQVSVMDVATPSECCSDFELILVPCIFSRC